MTMGLKRRLLAANKKEAERGKLQVKRRLAAQNRMPLQMRQVMLAKKLGMERNII